MGDLVTDFGKMIRSRRRARGLTQAQLAEAANLSLEWISRIERGEGKPSLDAVEALAPALGVSVPDLFLPITQRQVRVGRIEAMLQHCTESDLMWLEGLVKAALAYPKA